MEVPSIAHTTFDVPELCCSEEMTLLEKGLARVSGVETTRPDYVNRTLRVDYRPELATTVTIAQAIENAGFTIYPHVDARDTTLQATKRTPWRWRYTTTLGGILLLVGVIARFALGETVPAVVALLVASTTASAVPVFRSALRAVRLGAFDMNVLMSIAAIGALAIGEYFEGATAMFLFAISLWLESHSMDRARRAVASLVELSPNIAHRVEGQRIADVEPAEIRIGDCVLVRPGERVPIDGLVLQGDSTVNQAAITGESIPVEKEAGERVFAGSLNGEGSLRVQAERTADESTLAHIARLVAEAETRRAPTERFIDHFARRYTPVVIILAVILAFGPPLLAQLGAAWAAETAASEWFRRGLVLLVIACPCALVISTPVAIVCGLFQATRRGILIKGGEHLEAAGRVNAIALDKTGTLTTGTPRVVDIVAFSKKTSNISGDTNVSPGATAGLPNNDVQDVDQTANLVLQAAATLESHSEHPLARALVEEARRRGLTIMEPSEFKALRGFGVEGTVDGKRLWVGSPRLFAEGHVDVSPVVQTHAASATENETGAVLLVATEESLLGMICLADSPRVGAKEALASLRSHGVQTIVMLTGDCRPVAESIGDQLGIDETFAELSPGEKAQHVEKLAARWPRLAMAGDGVNDAPALAAAPLGIALGRQASDTALETADVVVMTPTLGRLAELIQLGRRCRQILRQNIVFALAVKASILLLAAAGMATLWMAVFADVGAGLLVTFNSLRLVNPQRTASCKHECACNDEHRRA